MVMKMTGERRFSATLDGTEKGRVYVLLPFDPRKVWGVKTRYHVAGTINGRQIRGALETSGKGHFLALGPAWRRDCGMKPGDAADVVLALEGLQRRDLAPDIAAALEASPEAASFFDSLAQFYVNGYVRWIDATKRRPEVRAERIALLVKYLRAGHKERPE